MKKLQKFLEEVNNENLNGGEINDANGVMNQIPYSFKWNMNKITAAVSKLDSIPKSAEMENIYKTRNPAKEIGKMLKFIKNIESEKLDESTLVRRINNYFNSKTEELSLKNLFTSQSQGIIFKEDSNIYGVIDYWATPLESMGLGYGDCEDYALAKYLSLLHLGVPDEKLRIKYVKVSKPGQPPVSHVVLGYSKSGDFTDTEILDNLSVLVSLLSERKEFESIYEFNTEYVYKSDSKENIGGITRIPIAVNFFLKSIDHGFMEFNDKKISNSLNSLTNEILPNIPTSYGKINSPFNLPIQTVQFGHRKKSIDNTKYLNSLELGEKSQFILKRKLKNQKGKEKPIYSLPQVGDDLEKFYREIQLNQ